MFFCRHTSFFYSSFDVGPSPSPPGVVNRGRGSAIVPGARREESKQGSLVGGGGSGGNGLNRKPSGSSSSSSGGELKLRKGKEEWALSGKYINIGRHMANDIKLPDDPEASRKHAIIR